MKPAAPNQTTVAKLWQIYQTNESDVNTIIAVVGLLFELNFQNDLLFDSEPALALPKPGSIAYDQTAFVTQIALEKSTVAPWRVRG